MSMWGRRYSQDGLTMTFNQSVTTRRPFCIATPSGVCIQLFAERLQEADSSVPNATMQVAKK